MATQFETGNVVRLMSGGPLMTVKRTNSDGETVCEWFNEEGHKFEHRWHAFKPEMLKPVSVRRGD